MRRLLFRWQRILEFQAAVRDVKVDDSIVGYMLDVVEATRKSPDLSVGVSTRGALLWYRATQSMAFVDGREFAIPDDSKNLAIAVLAHRVQATGIMQGAQRERVEQIINEIISQVPLPT